MSKRLLVVACVGYCLWAGVGCSDDSDDSSDKDAGNDDSKSGANGDEGTSQRPPQGEKAVEAWLAKADYKDWECESEVHEARSPSPHGFNRICSNEVISSRATDSGDWPAGAAAVKELYADADAKEPFGYSVYLKTKSDSAGGANWYWYERYSKGMGAPLEGVVADGLGDKGPAKSICVGCHAAAGSDMAHTPSDGGRDQVYTPVP